MDKKNEKRRGRVVCYICPDCQRKMGAAKYCFIPINEPPRQRRCESPGLCGYVGPITAAEMFQPVKQYRKRTGGGERAKAGRRQI